MLSLQTLSRLMKPTGRRHRIRAALRALAWDYKEASRRSGFAHITVKMALADKTNERFYPDRVLDKLEALIEEELAARA